MGYPEGDEMRLSTNFTLEEFTASGLATRLGIDNTPTDEALDNLHETAAGFERIRSTLGVPIHLSSGYRGLKLNKAAHGSENSQHCKGEAGDYTAPAFGTPLQVCRELVEQVDFIDFDQLIFEGTWVHTSFSDNPRRSVLTAHFDNGKVTYTKGLP
jgi:hypothetical protein